MRLAVQLPASAGTKASSGNSLPNDYNDAGVYEGNDSIKTLDVYIINNGTLLTPARYSGETLKRVGNLVYPASAIEATEGTATAYVVLNAKNGLGTTIPADEELIEIENLNYTATVDNGKVLDFITMTGRSKSPTAIHANIAKDEVEAEGSVVNQIKVAVDRLVSRVIVTKSSTLTTSAALKGAFSEISYAIAQGTKKVYLHKQPEYEGFAYGFLPTTSTYISDAATYYVYDDLFAATKTEVVVKPADFKTLAGKFLYENTHEYGIKDVSAYKKGNTAYVLIRTKFTPDPAALNGGTLESDGTFFVGGSDGLYYSNARAAVDAGNTTVRKYDGGKVLYYAWLNPDNVAVPYNSPVVRNNIYHINITGFKKMGVNWNPLFPETPGVENPSNPDPKPKTEIPTDPADPTGPKTEIPEPGNPVKPTDPLTVDETWLSVDVTVLPWTVHSYDIELAY